MSVVKIVDTTAFIKCDLSSMFHDCSNYDNLNSYKISKIKSQKLIYF